MKRAVFTTNEAVANQSGAMEADTISKNGRSSKSLTSRKNIRFLSTLCTVFVVCLVFTGCPKDPETSTLTISMLSDVETYCIGDWADFAVKGDIGNQGVEVWVSCLAGEPQNKSDEPVRNGVTGGNFAGKPIRFNPYTRIEEENTFTFSPETIEDWVNSWAKIIAQDKQTGIWSEPIYIRICPCVEFSGHCYLRIDQGMTWFEAKACCERLGGHLATITSHEEQNFIESLIAGGKKHYYWLGGTDEKVEGEWVWITGEPWGYTNWFPGQPDNRSGIDGAVQNYLAIASDKPNSSTFWGKFSWQDIEATGDSAGEFISDNSGIICEWSR